MKRILFAFAFFMIPMLPMSQVESPPAKIPDKIVLVTIDTWRWDAIGASGEKKVITPNLDAFARNGIYCRKAWTSAGMTTPSHASILTGVYPFRHGIRDNHGFVLDGKVKTLGEQLKERGYSTAAFVSGYPLVKQFGLDRGFDTYDDRLDPSGTDISFIPRERKGGATLAAVLKWLKTAPPRYFLWVHFYDPHQKYEPPAPFLSGYKNPYYGEVAFVDSLVGKLRDAVETVPGRNDALWIICGDHGESLGAHGEETHGIFVYDETSRVPLIFSGRGASRAEIGDARLIDILPTTMSLLGLKPAGMTDGSPLLVKSRLPFRVYTETMNAYVNFGAAPVVALSDGRLKAVEVPRRELYDLVSDPSESVNIYRKHGGEGAALFSELEELMRNDREKTATAKVSGAEEKALESLGYIGSSGGIRSATMMDPKDFIERHKTISSAIGLFERREYEKAVPAYEALLLEFPKSPRILGQLGVCCLLTGKFQKGEARLKEALSLDPRSGLVLVALGNLQLKRGDTASAEKYYLKALRFDPDNVEGNLNLGVLYREYLKDQGKARPYLERFLELVPDDPEAPKIRAILKNS